MRSLYLAAEALSRVPTHERLRALKRIVPRATIDAILRSTGHATRRYLRLPAGFVVWFTIALGLFRRDSYRHVFKWLQPYTPKGTPGRSTLCEARHRLGAAPLCRLAAAVIQLRATDRTPGAFYKGLRLMALDSFVLDLADSPANDRAFGRPRTGAPYPQARVLALCEVGTHVLWRTQIKPGRRSEVVMAGHLVDGLRKDMLVLWDRGFLGCDLVQRVGARRAHVLARIRSTLVFRPLHRFADGSFRALLYPSPQHRKRDRGGIRVRIIEYTLDDPTRPGHGARHRLLTTLLDARRHPARSLVCLYHERWEEEVAIDELKTHQRERPVLRSQTPGGVVQEIHGLLLAHYVVRVLMCEAARTNNHLAPRRMSFTGALKVLRCRLSECPKGPRGQRAWYERVVSEIAEEVLPERRDRINPRVIKCKMSHWKKKRPPHRRWPQPTKTFRQSIAILN